MGLFSRNRTVVADTAWQPVGDVTALTGADASMDDEGQVQPVAYRVDHEMPSLPGPLITVWTYATYLPGDAGYGVGLRYRYSHEDDGDWSYDGYAADPAEAEFRSVQEANREAEEWAHGITQNPAFNQAGLTNVFDWDGQPFPVEAG